MSTAAAVTNATPEPAMMGGAGTARRILESTAERLEQEAAAIRSHLAEMDGTTIEVAEDDPEPAADGQPVFDPLDLLDVVTAASRFSTAEDTIRYWLRRDSQLGCKVGGRWRVSIKRMRTLTGHK